MARRTEGDDVLDALQGRPIMKLPAWERVNVRKEARKVLAERHARELAQLEDAEAQRRLDARAGGLW